MSRAITFLFNGRPSPLSKGKPSRWRYGRRESEHYEPVPSEVNREDFSVEWVSVRNALYGLTAVAARAA